MTGHSPHNKNTPSDWEPCPSGELSRLAKKLRTRRHRRAFLQQAGAVTALALVGGGLWLWLKGEPADRPGETNFGGLTCEEVRELAQEKVWRRLDAERREKVRLHVTECPNCQCLKPKLFPA